VAEVLCDLPGDGEAAFTDGDVTRQDAFYGASVETGVFQNKAPMWQLFEDVLLHVCYGNNGKRL
jgi:hypothetical protein